MEPINKSELTALLADKTRLSAQDISRVLKTLGEVLSENMHRGVSLPGVGEMKRLRRSQNTEQAQHQANEHLHDITVVLPDSAFEDKVAWNVAAAEFGQWLPKDPEPGAPLDEHKLVVEAPTNSVPTNTPEMDAPPRFKVGGTPDWLESPDIPRCCGTGMTFYAQLDTSFPPDFTFWDCAMIYIFVCNFCGSHATKVQSY
ncbi:MAG TPA: hypothetical protein DDW52_26165 [Planctomycetaceae bacterium]|nr:hypothetical protein [Planctomycetaceae bacterium]